MSEDVGVPFTKKMRIVTREIHDVSDALINAKLGIGKSSLGPFVIIFKTERNRL